MSICIPVCCLAHSRRPYLQEEGLAFGAGVMTLRSPRSARDVVHSGSGCQLNPGLP